MQDPDTCKCDVEPWVAATCKDNEVFTETCGCLNELNETNEPECFYQYRLDIDTCQCEAPPVCDLAEIERPCAEGQMLDKWECKCVDMPLCQLCGSGFKQNPLTCECNAIETEKDVKCPMDGVFDLDTCSCTVDKNGLVVSKDARCPKGYELSEDCATCLITDLELCKPQKCAWGQGWDFDNCQCGYLPECPADAVTEDDCAEGERYDPMICGCRAKPETQGRDGGQN